MVSKVRGDVIGGLQPVGTCRDRMGATIEAMLVGSDEREVGLLDERTTTDAPN